MEDLRPYIPLARHSVLLILIPIKAAFDKFSESPALAISKKEVKNKPPISQHTSIFRTNKEGIISILLVSNFNFSIPHQKALENSLFATIRALGARCGSLLDSCLSLDPLLFVGSYFT